MDDFLIVQRKLYIYEGSLVIYTSARFDLSLTFDTGPSGKVGFSLPICSDMPQRSIDTHVGSLTIDKCSFYVFWNTITEFEMEFLSLCIPKLELDYLSVMVQNEHFEATLSEQMPKDGNENMLCSLPTPNSDDQHVTSIMLSSCCWLEPVHKLTVMPQSQHRGTDLSVYNIYLRGIYRKLILDFISSSFTRLQFQSENMLAYIHMDFTINSTAPVIVIPGMGGPCIIRLSFPVENDTSHILSYEWKSTALETNVIIAPDQFHKGAQVNFSYVIMKYTSYAKNWKDVHPRRVFTPLYQRLLVNITTAYNRLDPLLFVQ